MNGNSKDLKKISWRTLNDCAILSAFNTVRLVEDARILLKYGRDYPTILSSMSLLALALQEVGKICLAWDYYAKKQDISYDDYKSVFLNHRRRIDAAKKFCKQLQMPWGKGFPDWWEDNKKDIESLRLATLYTDYDFELDMWFNPLQIGPDGSLSPAMAVADLFQGKDRDEVFSSLRSKEYQVVMFDCNNMIIIIINVLKELKRRNKKIFKNLVVE